MTTYSTGANLQGRGALIASVTTVSHLASSAIRHSLFDDPFDPDAFGFEPAGGQEPGRAIAEYWGSGYTRERLNEDMRTLGASVQPIDNKDWAKREEQRRHFIRIIAGWAAELADQDAGPLAALKAMTEWEARSNLPPAHTLTAKLAAALCEYWRRIEDGPPDDAPEGISWPDAVLIDMLRDITAAGGDPDKHHYGRELADKQTESARKRFATAPHRAFFDLSAPGLCHYPRLLAKALWLDQVKPSAGRVRRNVPALATITAGAVRQLWRPSNKIKDCGNQLELITGDTNPQIIASTPYLDTIDMRTILEHGTKDLRSMTGLRLINWLVRTVHTQFFAGATDWRSVIVPGGMSGLAELIGERSASNHKRIERALVAGWRWNMSWPGGSINGLWGFHYDEGSGSHKASHVKITLLDPLTPHAHRELNDRQQTLTPMVEIGPMVSPARYYAPQAAFQQAMVGMLVDRRQDLAKRGSAHITQAELWQEAKLYGLPQKTMGKLLDRWQNDGDDGPAFLVQPDRDRWHLADNDIYGDAREFINDGARRAAAGRAGGRKTAARRKAMLTRKGKNTD